MNALKKNRKNFARKEVYVLSEMFGGRLFNDLMLLAVTKLRQMEN